MKGPLSMHAETTRTLLLSRGHQPIQIISWQRALTLLALEKVDVLEEYAAFVRSPSKAYPVPAVVRLKKVVRQPDAPVRFSRVNIYARDRHRCQYCGKDCTTNELTYDHVIPRSRGGATSWENIVSACYLCNRQKAARTPAEAGMKLAKRPVRPRWLPATQICVSSSSIPDAWRDYVYWTADLGTDGE